MSESPACIVCGKEGVLKCGGCGTVSYCCEEHKKNNYTVHKMECKPYRVEESNKLGRYLVTCRDVKQGELILRERPVVVGPRVDSLPTCLECFTLLYPPVSRCPACGVTPLCPRCCHDSIECQFYASLSQAQKNICLRAGYQYVLPLKILLHIKSGDVKYRDILKMESHLQARVGSDVWNSHKKNVVQLLQTLGVINESKQEINLVQHICGVLDVNSFEVRGASGLPGAGLRLRGVYVEAALMAHDCLTNVHLSVDDHFVMTIRASVDIAKGQPILYNYTDPLQTTSERQKHLREGKYFHCVCKRCKDPTELGTLLGAVLCPSCKAGNVTSTGEGWPWSCGHCNRQFSAGLMSLTTQIARDRLETVDRNDTVQLEQVLKSLRHTFPASHSVMIDVKQSIVAAWRDREPTTQGTRRKVELCQELLPTLRVLEPGISRLRGITLYELHIGLVQLAQESGEAVAERLREAEVALKESVTLLLHEPTESPEGELAKQALGELRQLKQLIAIEDKRKNKKEKHNK